MGAFFGDFYGAAFYEDLLWRLLKEQLLGLPMAQVVLLLGPSWGPSIHLWRDLKVGGLLTGSVQGAMTNSPIVVLD